jgi:type I restriction enzyme S subunit
MNSKRLLAHYASIADAPDAIVSLRRFILDLAVRGKLVPQDPKEGSATDLLKRIWEEKAQLAKAGRIRTLEEPLTAGADGLPFDLPGGWRCARLGDVVTKLTDGTHHSPPNERSGDFKYITAKNIKDDGISLTNVTYVSRGVHEEIYARCNPQKGDILYIKDGATTGVVTINDLDEPFSMLSSVALLKLPSCLSNKLIVVFLRSPFFYDQMRGFMKGAAITRVTLKRMAPALIPIPPLAEQHRIVAKVDELMTLCDRLEAARAEREVTRDRLAASSLACLNAPDPETFQGDARFVLNVLPALTTRPDQIKLLRETILNLAVRGELVPRDPKDEPATELLRRIGMDRARLDRKERGKRRPSGLSGDAQLFHLPSGWAVAPLADLVSVLNGRAYKQSELLSAGTPVLRVGNLFTSDKWYYSDLQLEEDKYCDTGDLLFAWSASFGPFIWAGKKVIYHYHIWKLSLHSEAELDKLYLYDFLLQKTREIKESGHGISMIHMTKEKMEKLQVPVPPLAEQRRIVAKVNELMTLCDRLEASLTTCDDTRRRLLDALLAEALAPGEPREMEAVA